MREPPRILRLGLLVALSALLVYPLHRPYLHPDQDIPPTLPLVQMARGSWQPLILMYGSALPNLLHVFDLLLFEVGRLAGWWREPVDLLVAWCQAPWLFRIPPRAIAMGAGIASLVAAHGIVRILADRWTALAAPALLGTWILFVREHHHGWYDAPAAGTAMLALWAATAHVRTPRTALLVAAGALAGLAASFKFNLAIVVPSVLAAALVAEPGRRLRAIAIAVLAAGAAFVATTPESVLDTRHLVSFLAGYIDVQGRVLAAAAGDGGNHLLEILTRGIGRAGLALAAAGVVVAIASRDRAFAPLLAFVALYGLVLVRTPLALSRYALPIAGPLAVLGACAVMRWPRFAGATVIALLVGLGLPGCVRYVALLAVEDTRTQAARDVEAEWARGGRVLVAANPVLAMYVGPDLPQLPRYDPWLSKDVEAAVAARAPRCLAPVETLPPTRDASALRRHAGALVVTTDPPATTFEKASTPAELPPLLAREARLVADLGVETARDERAFEPFDLNYVPFTGLGSLRRPGPRLRIWRVPETIGDAGDGDGPRL